MKAKHARSNNCHIICRLDSGNLVFSINCNGNCELQACLSTMHTKRRTPSQEWEVMMRGSPGAGAGAGTEQVLHQDPVAFLADCHVDIVCSQKNILFKSI